MSVETMSNLFEIDKGNDDEFRSPLTQKTKPKYLFFCIPMSWVVLPEEGEKVQMNNGPISTTFLLLNAMIGSGILVQAYAFRRSGIIAATIEYVILGFMNYTGVDLLIRSAEVAKIFDYSELAIFALGPKGGILVDTSIVVMNAGALLSYILIIGQLVEDVVEEYAPGCSAGECQATFLTALPVLFFVVPLCLIRQFGHLTIISYWSIGVISSTIMLVLIGGPIKAAENRTSDPISTGNFIGSLKTIGSIIFALGYTTAAFHAYTGLEPKTPQTFSRVAIATTTLGVLMCYFTGFAGYLSFRSETDTNILENFNGNVGVIFKLALVVHLILYIPGDFVIMRFSLLRLFKIDVVTQSDRSYILMTLAIILTITFIAVMLQEFASNSNSLDLVIDVTGGFAGSFTNFIVPGMIAVKLLTEEEEKQMYYKAMALAICGGIIVVLVIAGNAL